MSTSNDIAIVGMALRVPGAASPEVFWQNLKNGHESLQFYSDEVLRARGVSAVELSDPNYVRAGMPLEGFDEFDPEFFGFSPKDAAILDPQHRLFYEVAWEALERAGCVPGKFEGPIGVFAGSGMAAYLAQNVMRNTELMHSVGLFLLRHTGNDKDFLTTRVSYAFDLKGPSINVQTACSTSLVAVHMGAQSLLAREVDVVLAGGVTIELPHGVGYTFKQGEILSPDGHCRPFDHNARGTVFGSGVGVVVLRRLEDALRDNDHIHAVIKASAINNDGASKVGFLAPSIEGQAAAISEAIAVAGIDSSDIRFVECHGTGTPLGDPIEVAALTQAFRETSSAVGHCLLGSVKANVGHLDTAAGVIGLIKAAQALEHEAIPPTPNFERHNPAIAFEGSPFAVAATLLPWPRSTTPRRAAVNSLGVGGTNAFVVLQEAPDRQMPGDRAEELIALSARSRKALDDQGARLLDWIRRYPNVSLRSFAATLGRGRQAFEQRRVFTAGNVQEVAALLGKPDARRVFTHAAELDKPSIVFMFPGGGAQYCGMARELHASEPVFRDSMDLGLRLLKERHGVDLHDLFFRESGEEAAAALGKPSLQLPLVFLLELALVDLWRAKGVEPAALIGHSMGENAAACVAGVFSREQGLALVVLRGRLMDEVPEGGMLSVAMGADDIRAVMGADLDIAASNSPQLSIVSGPRPALDALAQRLATQGIESRRVRINIAAHSRMLEGILGRFREFLRGMTLNRPALPVISNLTGEWLTDDQATDPEYWVRHLRNTVRYSEGLQKLLEAPQRVFIEVGPGGALGSFVRQLHGAPVHRVIASLRHPDDQVSDGSYFRTMLGRLWAMGMSIPSEQLWCAAAPKIPLPTYPFQHARYWIEPSEQGSGQAQYDALVPARAATEEEWFWEPRWVQKGLYDQGEGAPQTWCVFHDRDPLLLRCIETLRNAGHRVVEVVAGDTFMREGSDLYTVAPEGGGSAYQSLVQSLLKDELLPNRILHSWLITRSETYRPGRTFLHRNQESGFYSLFYLARAFAKYADDKTMHWTVVGNEAVTAVGERLSHPDKATALAACAVIPRELPGVTCAYVDVDIRTGGDPAAPADWQLIDELSAPPCNEVVAWRNKVRWVRYLAPSSGKTAKHSVQIRSGGAYLITGGFGGIAGVVSEWLAREYHARLVLMARTPLPPRADWNEWLSEHGESDDHSRMILRIQELESLGATVLAIAADVSVAEQMEDAFQAMTEAFGRIDGVFHTAGVLRDGLLALKSEREIEEVLAPKLYGTRVLDELLKAHPPDFLMLFSSISSFVAPVGQLDYVAANTFLNAYAESCRGLRPYPVVAVNWGIWNGIGMVAPLRSVADAQETWKQQIARSERRPLRGRGFISHHVGSDGTAALHWIEGQVSVNDWMIDEHRLMRGDALLPATGYVEIVRAAMVELGLTPKDYAIHALTLLRPFYVEEHRPATYRVRVLGGPRRWRVEFFLVKGGDGRRLDLLATARLAPAAPPASGHPGMDELRTRCAHHVETAGSGGLRTRQEAHVRFGSRWRVLRQIGFADDEAFARIELDAALLGDLENHPSHPAMLDVATGCAMDLIPGYREQETPLNLWVPQGYGRYVQYRPLPAVLKSWIRLRPGGGVDPGKAQFDITLFDEQGDVVAELEELQLHKLEGVLPPAAAEPATEARVQSPAERAVAHNIAGGFTRGDGELAFRRVLASMETPVQIVSSFRPADLLKQGDAVARLYCRNESVRFARPELDASYEAPRDELEKVLSELWGRLLGVEGVGIRDSFFDLGGHSLVAVRLFNEVADRYGIDLPLSALMQHPDIASLAERIRGGEPGQSSTTEMSDRADSISSEQPFNYIVPMHASTVGAGVPFFMVAGMFGNVLNLSHMAHLLGEDRPFYALQARGLFADQQPFETFEAMAAAYLEEVRRLQPEGPYILGGFSGGGLVAFEMARQLLETGEPVSSIIMLDTPIRENDALSFSNKLEILWSGLKEEGPGHIRKKLNERRAWKDSLRQREHAREQEHQAQAQDEHRFRSQRVGDAFVRALNAYVIRPTPVNVALFRPRLRVKYRLRDGRMFAADRTILLPDNGWTPYVAELSVAEVPGNHDSMVLEPNVRVLVQSMRRSLLGALASKADV
jgi:acyl transferase domain-containing protein/thioesterase domain-containing protein/acyl carrier protein